MLDDGVVVRENLAEVLERGLRRNAGTARARRFGFCRRIESPWWSDRNRVCESSFPRLGGGRSEVDRDIRTRRFRILWELSGPAVAASDHSCRRARAKGGTAFGWRGPLITISLGRDATISSLADDWLLTHEMVHLAFPSLAEEHHWLEEGLATYVEPIARARIGILKPERVWRDLIDGLPQGQPESGDRGLDGTPTWGRTYWGGALFCLRADIMIRQRTGNRFGLEDSLRAILAAGGSIDRDWTIDRVIEIGDGAVGVPALRELYEQMGSQPVTVDLEALWRQLGISRRGDTVVFDDKAPSAEVRKAITPVGNRSEMVQRAPDP